MKKGILILLAACLVPLLALAETRWDGPHRFKSTVAMESTLSLTGDLTTDGNVDLNTSGKTIVLEDGTAASTCVGTATANGTSAVTIATTCAETGDYIFISANGADVNTANCWATNIVDGVSFDLDCDAASTTSFNWFIVKGQ